MFNRRNLRAALAGLALMVIVPTADAASSPSQTPGARPGVLFGLVDGRLVGSDPDQMYAALNQDASVGVVAVRAQLSWSAAEPHPGVYNWASFDQIVQAVAAHGMQLLVVVDFTPPWARPAGCFSFRCAPADPAQFAAFARQAAVRYGSRVRAWEIWNEPNSRGFWEPAPNASGYSRLVEDTAVAIRSADPGAFVVSGGLAPEADSRSDISPVTFLQGMCAAGALSSIDAVGLHPYSSPVMPDYRADWNAWQQMADTPVSARSVMADCGAGAKPIWITEYGAPTDGPGPAATSNPVYPGGTISFGMGASHVTPKMQAAMITEAVTDVQSYGWVGAFFVYSATDRGTAITSNQNFFGLRTYYGKPKPAWGALQAALSGQG